MADEEHWVTINGRHVLLEPWDKEKRDKQQKIIETADSLNKREREVLHTMWSNAKDFHIVEHGVENKPDRSPVKFGTGDLKIAEGLVKKGIFVRETTDFNILHPVAWEWTNASSDKFRLTSLGKAVIDHFSKGKRARR